MRQGGRYTIDKATGRKRLVERTGVKPANGTPVRSPAADKRPATAASTRRRRY